MRYRSSLFSAVLLTLLVVAGCSAPKETAVVTERPEPPPPPPEEMPDAGPAPMETITPAWYDTVRAGRFDQGKMWTFDNPPLDFFAEAYDFRPDSLWFERARLGALRFASYCSASFVSPHGLVMTNHHCARESITEVSEGEENLLDNGFYAPSLEAERAVPDLYVDQLVAIDDVTQRIYAAVNERASDEAQGESRANQAQAVQEELTEAAKQRDTTLYVQVIELYDGGQYSAYTFKRYDDVRLVMAPELQIGYYGGDPDNFTYPRYNLDMAFFRAYDQDGEPLEVEHYFPWSDDGAQPGEAVFVIGNPGSTSRLSTVAQLEYERDVALPAQLGALRVRMEVLNDYIEAYPDSAEAYDLRNAYFSLANTIKATTGQLEGLRDPYLIARRAAGERRIRETVEQTDTLRTRYGKVFQDLAELQASKEALAPQQGAFTAFLNPNATSHVLLRAMYGYFHDILSQRGAPPSRIEEIKEEALAIESWPASVEKAFIAARLEAMRDYLGASDPTVRRLLGNQTPAQVADSLVARTALIDSTGYANLLEEGYLNSDDPSVEVIQAIAPLYFSTQQQVSTISGREENLGARLARARFAVFGTSIPPDASFSLRIADGVVKGYAYNGTLAPPQTTFYGLYGHYYSYGPDSPWDLPEQWLNPPETFDLSTPLNFVSTNDITGGNSGSPVLNRDLEIVGLAFDGNIESLPNEYLFRDATGRTVSVDSRGMVEALDEIYDADRLVLELLRAELAATEDEADAMMVE